MRALPAKVPTLSGQVNGATVERPAQTAADRRAAELDPLKRCGL